MTHRNDIGATETDIQIKEIANNMNRQPVVRTSEQFMSDVQKTLSDGLYQTNDEAIKGVLDYATSKGVSYKGVDSVAINEQIASKVKEEADPSLFDRFGETLSERNEAGTDIIERGLEGKTSAVEGGLLVGANFLGTLADLTGDAITEAFTEFTPESFQEGLMSGVKTLAETSGGEAVVSKLQEASKNLEDLKELDPVKGARFQGGLDTINGMLELAGLGQVKNVKSAVRTGAELGTQAVRKSAVKAVDTIGDISSTIGSKLKTTPEDELLKKLDLQTQKGMIDGVEVDIPKKDIGIVEKITGPVREKDTKVLAGRAFSPRTVGKNAKSKLRTVQDVEKNANEFYKNVRTGVIEGDISTIENAANTVVTNIDTIGARIGNAVKQVEGNITIGNDITDSITTALQSKGASVSPATSILQKFWDDLGDGNLSISDAFELKKAYSNEVSKLYKSGDAGTKQFQALSDAVKDLNRQIDEIIDTKLGDQFAADKEVFRNLKIIVDDIVASALVEGRRSPNTFAEQIGMIEGMFSPIQSVKNRFISDIAKANSRGGAWEELIKIYDLKAVEEIKQVTNKLGEK